MRDKGMVSVLASVALAADFASAAVFDVTKEADTADGACDADCSLREAVIAANADPDADVINVPSGTYLLSRGGAEEDAASTGDLDILEPVSIVGAGPATTSINAGGADRIFHAASVEARVRIRGFTILNGGVGGDGPAGRGGGIYADDSHLEVIDCVITEGSALSGGGIFIESTTGFPERSSLKLIGSTVSDCTATGSAGGVRIGIRVSEARVSRSTITGNTASADGGGLYVGFTGPVDIVASTIANNRGRCGGGIYGTRNDPMLIRNTVIEGNSASFDGGGICVDGSDLTAVASTIRDNVVDDTPGLGHRGGGIYLPFGGNATILDSEITGNMAGQGGGIEGFQANFTIRGSTISGNTVELFGGGMRLAFGTHMIENTTIAGNVVVGDGSEGERGGGIATSDSTAIDVTLRNVTVADNISPTLGQQLYCGTCDEESGSFVRLQNTIISGSGDVENCEVRFSAVAFSSEGGNLSTDTSCDLVDPSDENDVADMMLGMLGDNGGPTRTRELLAGSPAIGTAVPANCPANDQRGFGRDAMCDAGAFEAS